MYFPDYDLDPGIDDRRRLEKRIKKLEALLGVEPESDPPSRFKTMDQIGETLMELYTRTFIKETLGG